MKKLTQYIARPNSVLSGMGSLEHLSTIKNFPVCFGCVKTPQSEDVMCDLEWTIDRDGLVQMTKLVPLDILYQAQYVDGCGGTRPQYYIDLADYIIRAKAKSVLEIGGGIGELAQAVTERISDITWTNVEPNSTIKGTERIKIIPSFFDDKFTYERDIDTVVFSQVLEHAYDPHIFLEAISKFLKPRGKLIFAYPQLELWISRKYGNTLNAEHTMLLTDYFVDYLLAVHGFKILDKYAYKDHSHFYTCEKSIEVVPVPKLENRYEKYKKLFMDFVDYHKQLVIQLNQKIEKIKQPVYLFGAYVSSSYLFSFGLNRDKIVTILDNSPLKQGKRLYGTPFRVESPKILMGKGKAHVIIQAGMYTNEIKEDILKNINPDAHFL
jgi:SAM-dependent methyltransferase